MGGRRDDQGGGGSTLPALPDLVDLPVTLASQPLEVGPHLFAELLDFLVALRLDERILVEDLTLGDLGLVDVSRLGEARLLRVCERPLLLDRGLPVLLAQPLHRELVRCLRAVARHRVRQYSTGLPGRRRGLPGYLRPSRAARVLLIILFII